MRGGYKDGEVEESSELLTVYAPYVTVLISDPLYEVASKQSVQDLSKLGLNVLWGGDLMENWSADDFKNWYFAGERRERAAQCLITLMTEARKLQTQQRPISPTPGPLAEPMHYQHNRDQGPPALVVADAIFNVKSHHSGKSVVPEVQTAFREKSN